MASINSHRSVLGLFAVTLLGIGVIAGAARFGSGKAPVAKTQVVWKSPAFASQAAFSADGRIITILSANCERFDAKSGRLLSSWKAPIGGRLTPDGASIINYDEGKRAPAMRVKTVWQTRAFVFRGGKETTRTHSRVSTVIPYKGKSLRSFDTTTGAPQWTRKLPDDSPKSIHSFGNISEVTNQDVFLAVGVQKPPSLESSGELTHISRRDGKILKITPSQKDLNKYSNTTFVYKKNGSLLTQPESSRIKEGSFVLEENGRPQQFEVPASLARFGFFIPLIFDPKEQLLAGARSHGRSTYSYGSDDGTIYMWNAQGKLLWSTQLAKFTAQVISFSPDSKLLAVGGITWGSFTPGRLDIYEVATGKLVQKLTETTWLDQTKQSYFKFIRSKINPNSVPGYCAPVESLTWSPDGKFLGATYGRSGFKLWKIQ